MCDFSIEHIKGKSLSAIKGFGQTSPQGTHYKLSGEGPLVILIHGLGGYSFMFEHLANELEHTYKVLRYDLIGRGFSEPGITYDLVEHVEQLEGLLKELKLSQEPCRVIGHSMGGVIATAFTAAHSKQVKGCLLLSPAGAMDDPLPAFRCLQYIVNSCSCCCIPLFAQTIFSGPPPIYENVATLTNNDGVNVLSERDLERGDDMSLWLVEHCMASVRRNTGTPLAASVARVPLTNFLDMRNRGRNGIQRFIGYSDVDANGLKARSIPLFILFGEQDPTCPGIRIADYKAVFGEDNVSAKSTPGRHCFFVQSPEASYPLIHDFLGRC